jgi:hypothetical protein
MYRLILSLILCLVASTADAQKFSSPTSRAKEEKKSTPPASTPKFSSPTSRSAPPPTAAPKPATPSTPKFSSPTSRSAPVAQPARPVTPPPQTYKTPDQMSPKARANVAEESRQSYTPPPAQPSNERRTTTLGSNASPKARANVAEESRRSYEYTNPSGKKIVIEPKTVEKIQSKPLDYYTGPTREKRVVEHVHHYNYSRPYEWYYTQPTMHVGGGYSSMFWWMMMEWNAERRAQWFYHNRDRIEQTSYQQGLRDAEVARRIAELEAKGVSRDPNYVDPEFQNDPADMYDPAYIQAAHTRPVNVSQPSEPIDMSGFVTFLKWLFIIGGVFALVIFISNYRFGK